MTSNHYDIICLSLNRWDAPISSTSKSLALELSKNNRVFYIDHPYSIKDFLLQRRTEEVREKKNALLKGLDIYKEVSLPYSNAIVVTPMLTFPINFLPNSKLYDWLSVINNKIIIRTIRKIIKDFNVGKYVYINFFDPFFGAKIPMDIKPYRTVYHCVDDISQVAYSLKHGLRLEHETIRSFDYTLCTSKELTRIKSIFSPNVHYHPNAADISIFKNTPLEKNSELTGLGSTDAKMIGFTGSVDYRTNFRLLKKIAETHIDKLLVFVGPINTNEHVKNGLSELTNVRFIGPKQIHELPSYLQYFACAIIPYEKTILTKSIYPLKINEYLFAGKPVIATNFSEDICSFKDVAYIVDSDEEFIAAIYKAIEEDSLQLQKRRISVAEQNTWEVRAEQFWQIILKEPQTSTVHFQATKK